MLTLTTTLVAVAPNGQHTESRTHREPLTEAALLRAGTRLMTQEPDEHGWVVMALRTSG
jgi:hypothetical protein